VPQTLRGKIAVVTGAGRGVGSEIAQRLVKSGAKVVLVARSVDQLILTEDLISKTGGFVYQFQLILAPRTKLNRLKKMLRTILDKQIFLLMQQAFSVP